MMRGQSVCPLSYRQNQQTALIVSAETGYYDIPRAVMRDTVSTYLDIFRRSLVD